MRSRSEPPPFGSLHAGDRRARLARAVGREDQRRAGRPDPKTATVHVLPQRKWRIYVAPSAHTDIGYTDVQPKCAERHCQNIDAADRVAPPVSRFPLEPGGGLAGGELLNCAQRRAVGRFLPLAREGKLGIQALYCNILTGLCSPEEACRLTWFAHSCSREQGIPYRSAMISDVPTQEASLPMLLAGAGIRYFSSGINNDRAYTFTQHAGQVPLLVGRPRRQPRADDVRCAATPRPPAGD